MWRFGRSKKSNIIYLKVERSATRLAIKPTQTAAAAAAAAAPCRLFREGEAVVPGVVEVGTTAYSTVRCKIAGSRECEALLLSNRYRATLVSTHTHLLPLYHNHHDLSEGSLAAVTVAVMEEAQVSSQDLRDGLPQHTWQSRRGDECLKSLQQCRCSSEAATCPLHRPSLSTIRRRNSSSILRCSRNRYFHQIVARHPWLCRPR